MDKYMPLISIIVPVYNVENYLSQCIESIINQTYRNIEIILIDDGSTDNSGKICDEYAEKDSRIMVLHQSNGGHTKARQAGLAKSSGEYIAFIDSDDWIDNDLYEKMIRILNKFKVDIIESGHICEYGDKSIKELPVIDKGLYKDKKLFEELYPKMICDEKSVSCGIHPSLWTKLFKRDCLAEILMDLDNDILIGEDAACVYAVLSEIKSIYVMDMTEYHYRRRNNSVVSLKMDFNDLQLIYDFLYKYYKRNKNKEILLEQLYRLILRYILFKRYDLLLKEEFSDIPFGKIDIGSNIILYGAGEAGRTIYEAVQNSEYKPFNIIKWVDQRYEYYREQGLNVEPNTNLNEEEYDYIVIGVIEASTIKNIYSYLISQKIEKEKILMVDINKFDYKSFIKNILDR